MPELTPHHTEIKIVDPPDRLLVDVLMRVREEQGMRKARVLFIFTCTVLLSSAMGLVSGVLAFIHASVQSGLSAFLSLLVTDHAVIAADWQDFAYSVMETLPVMTLIVVLTLAVLFLWSLRYVLREYKRVVGPLILVHR